MNETLLRNLLAEADRGATDPPGPDADSLLTAALVRRRRTRRRRTGAAAAIAVIAASALMLRVPSGAELAQNADAIASAKINSDADWSLKRPVRSADAARLRLELAHLEREAQLRLRVVQAVMTPTDADADSTRWRRSLSGAELARLESARTAALSWQYATQVERELQNPAAARREYRRIAERFPETPWAIMAKNSFDRLSAPTNPSSL